MPSNPDAPVAVYIKTLELPDGRTIRIRAYDNGEVRFRLSGTPYVLAEAYLSGGPKDHAIIKLSPGKQGSATYTKRVDAPEVAEEP
jgi:hypothetical protein